MGLSSSVTPLGVSGGSMMGLDPEEAVTLLPLTNRAPLRPRLFRFSMGESPSSILDKMVSAPLTGSDVLS